MRPQHLFSKTLRKVCGHIFRLLSRDAITYREIVPCKHLKQIGTAYGGWVVPFQLLDSNSVCYCAGCGEDISFDLGLIQEFGCHVFGFDPTPRAIKYTREHVKHYGKYHFSEIGMWDREDVVKFYVPHNPDHVSHSILNLQKTKDYFVARVRKVSDIMRDNDHKKLDLLKLDIEGAEYRVIRSVIEDGVDIKILCVEYDECLNPLDNNYSNRIKESVDSLIKSGYSLICTEAPGKYTFIKHC